MNEIAARKSWLLESPVSLPSSLRVLLGDLRGLDSGSLEVVFPKGQSLCFCGRAPGPSAVLKIHSLGFARRLIEGDLGFAESYLCEEWSSPDLTRLLQLIAANRALIERFRARALPRLFQRARHWLNRNTRSGSRRNIHAHYDLGNEFYSRWLDPTMTYSSGVDVGDDLEASQIRKYARIATSIGLTRDHHVLEIGCGWGGFAEWAARFIGCRVTAITISDEQFAYARERIARQGLDDRVDIRSCDYRDIVGTYDRVVSIEMIEAVGEQFWPTYFATLRRVLKSDGRVALQAITIRDDLFASYRTDMDFIRGYVFPGGMLPTREIVGAQAARSGLRVVADDGFGRDYARTCALWRANFERAWTDIASLGFDERFRRLWTYYLSYCEAGFDAGVVDLRQIVLHAEP